MGVWNVSIAMVLMFCLAITTASAAAAGSEKEQAKAADDIVGLEMEKSPVQSVLVWSEGGIGPLVALVREGSAMAQQNASYRHDPDYMKAKGVLYAPYSPLCGP